MIKLAYALASEEHDARTLVETARRAEAAGLIDKAGLARRCRAPRPQPLGREVVEAGSRSSWPPAVPLGEWSTVPWLALVAIARKQAKATVGPEA